MRKARALVWAYWPLVYYRDAVLLQKAIGCARAARAIGNVLLLLQHPPTVTMGRRAGPEQLILPPAELSRRGIDCVRADRGGLATYHGPGQLVAYPLCALESLGLGLREFVRRLEQAVADVLSGLGLAAHCRLRGPGVWVNGAKIAAVGLRVRRGVTYHGLALNVRGDLGPFSYIHPCGEAGARVTSIEKEQGRALSPRVLARPLACALAARLGCRPRRVPARVLAAIAATWEPLARGEVGGRRPNVEECG